MKILTYNFVVYSTRIVAVKLFLLVLITVLISACLPDKRDEAKSRRAIKSFAAHLYIHYHKYSDRDRKDNQGVLKDTWPLTPRAHNPHDKGRKQRVKMPK